MRVLTVLGNEVHKGLRFAWSERLQILIELPFFALFILLLGPLVGHSRQLATGQLHWSLSSSTTSVLVVWFVPFIFFYMQVVKLFWRLLAEIQAGTIEQVYLTPLPTWLVLAAGRVIAATVETIVVAAASYGIVTAFVPLHLHWTPAALLPAALICVAGVGLSLVVAGATLVWKRVQLVNDTVLMLVMLFSAAAVPLISVPSWWAGTSRAFPLTAGVASLNSILLRQRSATTPWGMGGLVWQLVTAVGYLLAGIAAFSLGEHAAKRRGTLARYLAGKMEAGGPHAQVAVHAERVDDPRADFVGAVRRGARGGSAIGRVEHVVFRDGHWPAVFVVVGRGHALQHVAVGDPGRGALHHDVGGGCVGRQRAFRAEAQVAALGRARTGGGVDLVLKPDGQDRADLRPIAGARRGHPVRSLGAEPLANVSPRQGLGAWFGVRGDDDCFCLLGHCCPPVS